MFDSVVIGDSRLTSAVGDLSEAMSQLGSALLVGDDQSDTRRKIQDFCDRHDDALYRSCEAGHLTASAVVVDPVRNQTVLLLHRKLKRWLQPGGHCDGDGNLGSVALREATEETGIAGLTLVLPAIDVDIHTIPARPDEPEHLHLDIRFLVIAPAASILKPNQESTDARWFSGSDPTVANPDLQRVVARGFEANVLRRGSRSLGVVGR